MAVGRETKKPTKWPKGKWTRRIHRTLRLPWARALYNHRKTQGERPFAEIKATMGFRLFAMRGVSKVRGEWNLVGTTFNLKRIARIQAATLEHPSDPVPTGSESSCSENTRSRRT